MAEPARDPLATPPRETETIEGSAVERYDAPGLVALTPPKHGDGRGFLSETYSRARFAACGVDLPFVQDNHTYSSAAGTIRGLHFQVPPHVQGKLVRVVRGAVLDVAVDIRHGSPTFGRATAVTLSAANWRQLYVPPGFAHGFCTLTPDAEVLYRLTGPYAPAADRGLAFDDPDLAIGWGVDPERAVVSERDRKHPRLRDLPAFFRYEEGP